ncbi:MAG: hypothetical protein Q4E22_06035, partial [Coriobacteriia bacterium]|nr:hypothetical protein [Coriobacteriia bacterium]
MDSLRKSTLSFILMLFMAFGLMLAATPAFATGGGTEPDPEVKTQDINILWHYNNENKKGFYNPDDYGK